MRSAWIQATCLALLASLLLACQQAPQPERRQLFALGTLVDLTAYPGQADHVAAFDAAEAALLEEDARWRAWPNALKQAADLATINQSLAAGECVTLSEAMEDGVRKARELAVRSGQRFNPAIGRLVEAWQFHRDERPPAPPPDPASLQALLAELPNMNDLEQTPAGCWRSNNPALWLDMGAFAKGLAVDRAADALQTSGIDNSIVNAGGDLVVLGSAAGRPWRVGIRETRGDGVLAVIESQGREAIFTSGDYERAFEWEAARYHHILDPATGMPATGTHSVTVIHADAAVADAAATAIFIAGPDAWLNTARQLDVHQVLRVDASGDIEMTAAMATRVTLATDSMAAITVVD